MYVLYGLALVSFLLSYVSFKLDRRSLGNFLVTLGLFLNPLGFDLVVAGILGLTNDYWLTMTIMYGLAFTFFGLFFYFSDIRAYKYLKVKTKKTCRDINNKFKKDE